jgi:hypothetical protein
MGGPYQQMLPSTDLQDLPTPACAACHASRAQFVQADRGHVQRRLFETHLSPLDGLGHPRYRPLGVVV